MEQKTAVPTSTKRIIPFITLILGLICLISCQPTVNDNDSPIAAEPISTTRVTAVPTATISPTSTLALDTPTIAPPPTHTPIPIQTSSLDLAATPIPTIPKMESTEQILWLFETNNGCRLPCWWGITPGQTDWQEAERFLTTISSGIGEFVLDGQSKYTVYIEVPMEIYPVNRHQDYTVQNGLVQSIEVLLGNVATYELSNFLNDYSQPEEVWIRTYNRAREGDLPFDTVLYYPEKGFMIRYAKVGIEQSSLIQGCPQGLGAPILAVWFPDAELSFSEVVSRYANFTDEDWKYLPLEEATEMSTETFYETFKNPNNVTCLETPAYLWSSP